MAIVRQAYVISDLHLGGSPGFRQCSHVSALAAFLDALASRPSEGPTTELIINGDMVDFLAGSYGSPPVWRPFEPNGKEAAGKLETIASGEDFPFFEALRGFLRKGHRLVLLLGNHDIELALPEVRRALIKILDHDFQFLYDGEAYVVGDALIEHGNRYDPWNRVDYESLRRLRLRQSRHEPDTAEPFKAPAGSRLVCDVINPIKAEYPFVDLLKPETGAVVPLLLALEPGYRRVLSALVRLCAVARYREVVAAVRGDIASSRPAGSEPGGDLVATASALDRGMPDDPLRAMLEELMPGDASRFLAALGEERLPERYGHPGGEIASTRDRIDRAVGLFALLVARKHEPIERRLFPLRQALRVLQDDRTFSRDNETLSGYLEAATALSQRGFRFVIFGHTHLARDIGIGGNARYLNSGAWTDFIQFPEAILDESELGIEELRRFVEDIHKGALAAWVSFRPTYVRLDIDENDPDHVACATLNTYPDVNPL